MAWLDVVDDVAVVAAAAAAVVVMAAVAAMYLDVARCSRSCWP